MLHLRPLKAGRIRFTRGKSLADDDDDDDDCCCCHDGSHKK